MRAPSAFLRLPAALAFTFAVVATSAPGVAIPHEMPAAAPWPAAAGTEPPAPWPDQGFRAVTAARIAELPARNRDAWEQYWAESARRAALLPPRDTTDRSAAQPLAGGPVPSVYSKGIPRRVTTSYLASAAAAATADFVLTWQTPAGGWVKGGDYTRARSATDERRNVWSAGTYDNDSTITELRFLGAVISAHPKSPRREAWRRAFDRGLDYVWASQYPNGGFPQIYPLGGGYHDAITFNDDAMLHILELLREVAERRAPFTFVSASAAERSRGALQRGVECVLATQMRTPSGRLLVWGQQHDALTLEPCAARNFEPLSACSSESAGLVEFLLTLPEPSPAVRAAIDAAMAWFESIKYEDVRWDRHATSGNGIVPQPGAPALWARLYELATAKPVFGERDRVVHYAVTELSDERRLGYGWFNTRAADLTARYAEWKKRP